MSDKSYRTMEMIKHPVGIADRIFYKKNSLNVIQFIEKLTSQKVKTCHIEEYEQNEKILKGWKRKLIFLITRVIQPNLVVETGIGVTTVAFLQAMKLNKKGHLYSIDLLLKSGRDGAKYGKQLGHMENSYERCLTFIEGDSKIELPKILNEIDKPDIFYHDSLHTYEHMLFEYVTAYPCLKDNGFLLSDDIYWNHAFLKWAKRKDLYVCRRVFGGVKKVC